MIVAIIQARMGSVRLPDKTMVDLHGKPLLRRVIDRTVMTPGVQRTIVATTTRAEDEVIASCAIDAGVEVFRGSTEDVLDRFVGAARVSDATVIVRVTADDPFKDPDVSGAVIAEFQRLAPSIDYVSNTLELTYPEGLDIEVISRESLERAAGEATLRSEREHVTPYIYNRPDRFRLAQVRHSTNLSELRWTLDYPEDLAFARAVYERLDTGQPFGMGQILALLRAEPELQDLNQGFARNAGYLQALTQEQMS